jgi:hypothetical protein
VDEATQAAYHAQVVKAVVCDQQIASLHFFHFIDESDRDRFQSGAIRADGTRRASYDSVAEAVAGTGTGTRCLGAAVSWLPLTVVSGAAVTFKPATPKRVAFDAYAEESTAVVAGVYRVTGAAPLSFDAQTPFVRELTGAKGPKRALTLKDTVKAFYHRNLAFKGKLKRGFYVTAVVLKAETSTARQTSFVSTPFQVR